MNKPYSIESIKSKIFEIGCSMVKCDHHCLGVINDPARGILPRPLFLQTKDRDCNRPGIVVIGLHPGYEDENDPDIQYFKKHGPDYQKMLEWFEGPQSPFSISSRHPYIERLKRFIREIGEIAYIGPILWTERIKCQRNSETPFTRIDDLTKFICTETYLQKELKYIPKDWPVIIIGDRNYREIEKILKKEFEGRRGIVLPDPDKQVTEFELLFDKHRKLTLKTRKLVKRAFKGEFIDLFDEQILQVHIGPVGKRHFELFLAYIQDANKVMILNPYAKSRDQFNNIKRFCEEITGRNPAIQIWLVNSQPTQRELEERKQLDIIEFEKFKNQYLFKYCEIKEMHKRCIVTDTGWFIDTDRGFGAFKKQSDEEKWRLTIINYAKTDSGLFDRLLKEIERLTY